MIRSLNKVLISLVALVGLSGTANAAYVSWESDYSSPDKFLSVGGAKTFSYDLTTDGFKVGSGLLELNIWGALSVTITAITGDFYFGSHLLTNGFSQTPTTVPEPSSLALLGLGLLGVAAGVRRRA